MIIENHDTQIDIETGNRHVESYSEFRCKKKENNLKQLAIRSILIFCIIGVLFLLFISYLIQKQPFLIRGVKVKKASEISLTAFRAAMLYVVMCVLCVVFVLIEKRGIWLRRKRLALMEGMSLFSSIGIHGERRSGRNVSSYGSFGVFRSSPMTRTKRFERKRQ